MNSEKIVFFGADGGCLDALFLALECYKKSFNNCIVLSDSKVSIPDGCVHLGGFEKIDNNMLNKAYFVYQCGNVKNHNTRRIWFDKACQVGLKPLSCVSKHAYIHPTAAIGKGVLIYPGVKIMRNVKIGDNVIILPNTIVSHGAEIGSYTMLNNGVIINGDVKIGSSSFIGAGAQIREGVRVGSGISIGMGSLILKSIQNPGIYYGRPPNA